MPKPLPITTKLYKVTTSGTRTWEVRRGQVLLGFVEKFRDRRGEVHPFRIYRVQFRPGQSPALGMLVDTIYGTRAAAAAKLA